MVCHVLWPTPLQNDNRCAILQDEILKRNLKHHLHKVFFTTDVKKKVTTWIPVNDVTSVTREKELEKKRQRRENADHSIVKSTL